MPDPSKWDKYAIPDTPAPSMRMGITGSGADESGTKELPVSAPTVNKWDKYAVQPALAPGTKPPDPNVQEVGMMDYLTKPESVNAPSLAGFGRNVARSAGRFAGALGEAVTHPKQTAEAIGAIPVGLYEKAGLPTPKGWDEAPGGGQVSAKMLDSMLGHFKERYGSIEGAKKALYEDPVGVAADISAITGVAGAAAPGAVGRGLETVSRVTDPIKAATRMATAPVRAMGAPQRMYQSALKPGKPVGPRQVAETNKLLETGLQQKIPVTEGGLDTLRGRVGELDAAVERPIREGAAAGKTVDPYAVADNMKGAQKAFATQVNPEADLGALDRSRTEFLRQQGERPGIPGTPPQPPGAPQSTGLFDAQGNPVFRPGTPGSPGTPPTPPVRAQPIPADTAQELKSGTYRQLKNKSYGELKGADIEAQKSLAAGLRKELIRLFPEIKDKLALESDLMALARPLENRLRVAGNHDLMGIGTPIAGTLAAASGHSGVVGAAAKSLMDNPWFKSRAAIMLYNAGRAQGLSLPTAISRVEQWSEKPKKKPQGPAPPPVPSRSSGSPRAIEQAVTAAARANGVDEHLARAVAKNESAFQANAVSPVGAQGVMQLMPGTGREMGVTDPFDSADNITAGVKYLKQLQEKYGNDWAKVASAYHAGPGNVDRGRIGPETKKYVEKVMRDRESYANETPQFAHGGVVAPNMPKMQTPPKPLPKMPEMRPKPAKSHPWRHHVFGKAAKPQ